MAIHANNFLSCKYFPIFFSYVGDLEKMGVSGWNLNVKGLGGNVPLLSMQGNLVLNIPCGILLCVQPIRTF